ncbi:hypothetical protein CHH55_08665 [Niallia circulans]|uniref:DUF6092 family protein n=1 Tax=Niallia circulans TaxID=1397 RepID=UPI000BA69909|nr:DUF6092 family protein [Niallia circulans]PAD25898.1 hypothetical protein CHH62_10415 [Niallia circulans]PAD88486.1 hypothetical protein CHH55_08665 [Niallia circulans]
METYKNEKLVELVRDYSGYILTSAKGLYREPAHYGPLRMVGALERTLVLLTELGIEDKEMEEVLSFIRKEGWRALSDPLGYEKALDKSIDQLVVLTVQSKE